MDIDGIIADNFINTEYQPCILHSELSALPLKVFEYVQAVYGSNSHIKDLAIALISEWFETHRDEFIIVEDTLTRILSLPQIEQRTEIWLNLRYDLVTASILGRAIGLKGPSSRNGLLYSKAVKAREFFGTFPTDRGNRMEPVTDILYSAVTGRSVQEVGLIRHRTLSCLGASSDGIDEYSTNIEIKNVKSREITDVIPTDYWCQCQCQMEVLDLDTTNFVEVETIENELTASTTPGSTDASIDVDVNFELESIVSFAEQYVGKQYFGAYAEYYNTKTEEFEYTYSPACANIDQLITFVNNVHKETENERPLIYSRTQCWALKQISIKEVPRNRHWFQSIVPLIKKFAEELKYYRTLPPTHPEVLALLSSEKRKKVLKKERFKKCMLPVAPLPTTTT